MAHGPRVAVVTGGKGGVGKSTFALNLALAWAHDDRRVVVVDADLGLGTIEVMVDRNPLRHIGDWLAGEASLDEVSLPIARGVDLLPSGSGQFGLASLPGAEVARALRAIREWAAGRDAIVIDTGAGVGPQVLAATAEADDVVVVTTPEPTAVTEAYTSLKATHGVNPEARVWLLVNQADLAAARDVERQLAWVCERFLHWRPAFLGAVPADFQAVLAVRNRTPLLAEHPTAAASRAILAHARELAAAAPWDADAQGPAARAREATGDGGEAEPAAEPDSEKAASVEHAAGAWGGRGEDEGGEWEAVPLDEVRIGRNQGAEVILLPDGRRFRTWIEDTTDGIFRVAAPLAWPLLATEPGTAIEVHLQDAACLYRVRGVLRQAVAKAWEIEVEPVAGRQQRREFVRWPCSLAVSFAWWEPSSAPSAGEAAEPASAGGAQAAGAPAGDGGAPLPPGARLARGRTEDVSGGGMLLATEAAMPAGALLRARLRLPEREIAATGRVVRRLENDPRDRRRRRYGVQWVAIDRRDRDAIVRFIFSEQRRARQRGVL